MFKSIRAKKNVREKTEIHMTPLIDMVFILLIFFIVTTSFVSDTGLKVSRPQAHTSQDLNRDSMKIAVGASGEIYLAGQRISIFSLRSIVAAKLKRDPELSTVIIADKATPADTLVKVMDELRLGGIKKISLATEKI